MLGKRWAPTVFKRGTFITAWAASWVVLFHHKLIQCWQKGIQDFLEPVPGCELSQALWGSNNLLEASEDLRNPNCALNWCSGVFAMKSAQNEFLKNQTWRPRNALSFIMDFGPTYLTLEDPSLKNRDSPGWGWPPCPGPQQPPPGGKKPCLVSLRLPQYRAGHTVVIS